MQSSEHESRSIPISAVLLGFLVIAILYLGLPWLITIVIVWFSHDYFTFEDLFLIVAVVNFLLIRYVIKVRDRRQEKRAETEARERELIATWVCPQCGKRMGEPMLILPIHQPSKRQQKRLRNQGYETIDTLTNAYVVLVCAHCETLNCYDSDGNPQVDSVPWSEAEMLNAMADEANSRD